MIDINVLIFLMRISTVWFDLKFCVGYLIIILSNIFFLKKWDVKME
jgi:hypothetical protein